MVLVKVLLWLALVVGFYFLGCRLFAKCYREKIFPEKEERAFFTKREEVLKWAFLIAVIIIITGDINDSLIFVYVNIIENRNKNIKVNIIEIITPFIIFKNFFDKLSSINRPPIIFIFGIYL